MPRIDFLCQTKDKLFFYNINLETLCKLRFLPTQFLEIHSWKFETTFFDLFLGKLFIFVLILVRAPYSIVVKSNRSFLIAYYRPERLFLCKYFLQVVKITPNTMLTWQKTNSILYRRKRKYMKNRPFPYLSFWHKIYDFPIPHLYIIVLVECFKRTFFIFKKYY